MTNGRLPSNGDQQALTKNKRAHRPCISRLSPYSRLHHLRICKQRILDTPTYPYCGRAVSVVGAIPLVKCSSCDDQHSSFGSRSPGPRIEAPTRPIARCIACSRSLPTRPTAPRSHSAYATNDTAAGRSAASMDTSYLAQQVTTIIGQLHGLFDEIGVPSHERDSREAEVPPFAPWTRLWAPG